MPNLDDKDQWLMASEHIPLDSEDEIELFRFVRDDVSDEEINSMLRILSAEICPEYKSGLPDEILESNRRGRVERLVTLMELSLEEAELERRRLLTESDDK